MISSLPQPGQVWISAIQTFLSSGAVAVVMPRFGVLFLIIVFIIAGGRILFLIGEIPDQADDDAQGKAAAGEDGVIDPGEAAGEDPDKRACDRGEDPQEHAENGEDNPSAEHQAEHSQKYSGKESSVSGSAATRTHISIKKHFTDPPFHHSARGFPLPWLHDSIRKRRKTEPEGRDKGGYFSFRGQESGQYKGNILVLMDSLRSG